MKTILSIGGPGETTTANFAALAVSPAGRANFVESSLAILKERGFDGLDIHWQWPKDAIEAKHYTILLGELRSAMDEYAARNHGNRLNLSVACPVGREQYSLFDLEGMNGHVDFFNLLAYDYATPTASPVTAHQANMFTNGNGTPHNPAQAVSDLLDAEAPAEKILFGIPLYGRGFAHTEGLGKPFSGCPPSDDAAREAGVRDVKHLPPVGADVKMDFTANAAYSYDEDKKELFSFETEESVMMKAGFIQSQGLGGAVFWEASGDRVGVGSLGGLVSALLLICSKSAWGWG